MCPAQNFQVKTMIKTRQDKLKHFKVARRNETLEFNLFYNVLTCLALF